MTITSKQRAFLRGMANGYDPILYVGKGGINDALIRQADEQLTARELIKGRVLETAPESVRPIAEQIAAAVDAQVVQVIGRNFVLFRQNPKDSQITLPR